MRGPNLSPAPFLLHLDDQSQVKRKGAGEGHTEPMSRSSWRQQPANQHQLVKKPADETHNNKQDSVQFKKQKTKHNVKCIYVSVFLTASAWTSSSYLWPHAQFVTQPAC